MTNCCLGMLRGIWSFVVGSLRMILFFMCLLYVLLQFLALLSVCSMSSSDEVLSLPGVTVGASDFLQVFAGLFIGILGAYGAFYKHHPSLRAFSLLAALGVLVMTFHLLYSMRPEDLREQKDKIMSNYKESMPKYEWDHVPAGYVKDKATKSWDTIQSLMCCGIDGPNDWANYRPSGSKYAYAYPATCCLEKYSTRTEGAVCTIEDRLFATGCSERLSQIFKLSVMLNGFLIIYLLALTIIAYIVGSCGFEARDQSRHTVTIHTSPATIYASQQPYQQPPANRDYVDGPQAKQSLPPMYPNLHANQNYSAPPPSYGT